MKFIIFIVYFSIIFIPSLVESFDLEAYYSNHSDQTKEEFLKDFPYNQYLGSVPFTDFETIQSHRFYLWKITGNGDDFLYYLGENFIKLYPVTLEKKDIL